ncbi:MAG TPA: histidine kinase [Thermoanaerobaculia bacterium]
MARGAARAAVLLGAATLVSLYFASESFLAARHFGRPISFVRALGEQLACWYLWAAATPLVLRLAGRFPIERGRIVPRLCLHAAAGLVVSGLHVLAESAVFQAAALGGARRFGERLQGVFFGEFHADLIAYFVILAIGAYRARDIARTRLEARLARTELELLRSQLDPNFLFNTLNAISSLMHTDVEAADRMISRLADLLRMSLGPSGRAEVTLQEELDLLDRYLEIQRSRFPGKLSVAFRIEPSVRDARVPSWILPPLVERAVGRGVPEGSRKIEVSSRRLNGSLELRVRDMGDAGEDERAPAADEAGLSSTRDRLTRLYGASHRIEVRNGSTGCVSVTLAIPFRISVQEDSYGYTKSDLEDPRADRR